MTTFDNKDLEGANDKDKDGAELPDEYKGKSPQELVEIIQKQSEDNQSLNKRFEELNAEVMTLVKDSKDKKTGDNVNTSNSDNEPPDFYSRPREAAEQLIDAKLKPYADAFLSNEEVRQMQDVMKLPYADDDAIAKEIKAVMAQAQPAAKIQPGFAKAAYDYVIGKNLDRVREIDKKKQETAVEFTETGSSAGVASTKQTELTEDQKRVADGMGISHKDYLAWQDKPEEMVAAALSGKGDKK